MEVFKGLFLLIVDTREGKATQLNLSFVFRHCLPFQIIPDGKDGMSINAVFNSA